MQQANMPAAQTAAPIQAADEPQAGEEAGLESCEIEAIRLAESIWGGHDFHELRAVAVSGSGWYVAARLRYKAPHAVDLNCPEHRTALEALVRQLEERGWSKLGSRGVAEYNLHFSHPATSLSTETLPVSRGLADWLIGLTKHTKRLALFGVLSSVVIVVAKLALGNARPAGEWASFLAASTALVWCWAAYDDFHTGTPWRIVHRLDDEEPRHRLGWYRAYLVRFVRPWRGALGWAIPASMVLIALSYLSGVLLPVATVGALFLLANMFLFLDLRYPRDDYVLLTVAQLIILATNPAGLPGIVRAF